jgi:hypothetical protein
MNLLSIFYRNLVSVGTVGTVGTAKNDAACSRAHPNRRSGHRWAHTLACRYKPFIPYIHSINLCPLKKAVGTAQTSGSRMALGVPTVPTVPTDFEYQRDIGRWI